MNMTNSKTKSFYEIIADAREQLYNAIEKVDSSENSARHNLILANVRFADAIWYSNLHKSEIPEASIQNVRNIKDKISMMFDREMNSTEFKDEILVLITLTRVNENEAEGISPVVVFDDLDESLEDSDEIEPFDVINDIFSII